MKCRNIFCTDHDQETSGNCGYYQIVIQEVILWKNI